MSGLSSFRTFKLRSYVSLEEEDEGLVELEHQLMDRLEELLGMNSRERVALSVQFVKSLHDNIASIAVFRYLTGTIF